ncbi:hypothetical protein [Pseudokineococcus lusitanus]|uniref:Uncharacterized protein n=1 Tax=Pseudokineococcus lusitanus TaxID=763993 RepID=A0A3N1GWS9_9ACTN|nr:hypothetical protein [Pseudokineococcus lusitanus]ROP34731.1 hypothetical protein EDC03_2553 [Pseudokineococcus lusitanus]
MDERQQHLSLGDGRYERAPERPTRASRTSRHRGGGPVLLVGGLFLLWVSGTVGAWTVIQLGVLLHVVGGLSALAGLFLLLVNLDVVLRLVRERG